MIYGVNNGVYSRAAKSRCFAVCGGMTEILQPNKPTGSIPSKSHKPPRSCPASPASWHLMCKCLHVMPSDGGCCLHGVQAEANTITSGSLLWFLGLQICMSRIEFFREESLIYETWECVYKASKGGRYKDLKLSKCAACTQTLLLKTSIILYSVKPQTNCLLQTNFAKKNNNEKYTTCGKTPSLTIFIFF